MGWICFPKDILKSELSVLMTSFGNRVFAHVIKLRQGHAGLGWSGVFIRRERFGGQQTGRKPCRDKDWNQSAKSTSQGMSKTTKI